MSCERKYYEIYTQPSAPRSFIWPLEFGSAVHDVMGVYDEWHLGKGDQAQAIRGAVQRAVEISSEWEEWREDTKYNSWNLARIPVWYAEHFGTDDVLTWAPPPSPSASWLEYEWEYEYRGVMLNGRLDNLVSVWGENLIMDRKTTSREINGDYIQSFSPDIQCSLYTWVGKRLFPELEIGGLLYDAFQLQVAGVEFDRFIVRRTQDELDEFEDSLNAAIDRRKALEGRPEREWLMNPSACFGCFARKLCSSSKEERERLRGLIQ